MNYTEMGATISANGIYRFILWREWRGSADDGTWHWTNDHDGNGKRIGWPKSCLFIMLNPSTADGELDDPTIRRCVGYAKALKYDRLEVVNLFAYRATDPRQLLRMHHAQDPVGWENQSFIESAARDAGIIICAWGAHGGHIGQDETVLGWIDSHAQKIHALKLTQDGKPCHPLYLPADSKPFPFGGKA